MNDIDTRPREAADLDPEVRRFMDAVNAAFARHPDFAALPPARRREIAEEVRAPWAAGGPTMASRTDLGLDTPQGRVRIRVHDPSTSSPKPALIYLHGGGWTLFSIDTHDRLMREYAARAGVVVIGVDYALSPESKYPVALEQVVQVVRWARRSANDLGIDPERVALGGDSAGGNLTVAACLRLRDRGEPNAVRAMLLNYAALDSECSAAALRYGGEGYMLGAAEMQTFWRNYTRSEADLRDPLVCPLHADLRALPPAFLTIAECDILAEQNIAMAARLRAAGVATEAVVYPGTTHSFLEAVSIAAVSDRALTEASQWLRDTLGTRSAARVEA